MQKSKIDEYVNGNYKFLHKVATDFIKRKNRNYDPEIVVSESYIQILKVKDKITSVGQLQSFFISRISLEVSKQNSNINTAFKDRHVELIGIEQQAEQYDVTNEIKRNKQKAQIEAYYLSEKDSIKKIIFEAYFVKRYRTVRSLATYFNLSKQTAQELINELKKDIRNYGKV